MLAFTLTAFLELMDHGIVSWDLISLSFIKQVIRQRVVFLGHHSLFHSTGFLQNFMGSFFLSLFIFYVFIPAESEWALLLSYCSYYADIAARVWTTLTQGQTPSS